MRLTFLYHPKPYLTQPNAQIGLGLLCLATYARHLGADVRVANAQSRSAKDAIQAVPRGEVACLSGCCVDAPILAELTVGLARRGCRIVIGGPVADGAPIADADLTVRGPGEPIIHALVTGNWPRCVRAVEVTESLEFNGYPIADRTLLGEYLGGNIFHARAGVVAERSTTLMTARGCRFRCAFCRSGNRRAYCEYALCRIDQELRQIVELGVRYVRIADDNVAASRDRLSAVCDLLAKYAMRWRASMRTTPNDLETYRMMRDAGCLEVNIGVESADSRVLTTLRKGAAVDAASRAVDNAIAAGIPSVRALFMMGTPGETRDTYDLNRRWVDAHPEALVCLTAFCPFPGTPIYEAPEAFGCRLESQTNQNFYAFQGDDAEAEAHISIENGLSRPALTYQLRAFRDWLEARGQINHG